MPLKRECFSCKAVCFSRHLTEPMCRKCSSLRRTKRKGTREEYRREHHLKKKYNIDNEDFSTLWQVFEGRCAICKVNLTMPEGKKGQGLTCAVVDHDHSTGNLRAILCNGCNKGLGLFKDNPEILLSAWSYLNYAKTSNN